MSGVDVLAVIDYEIEVIPISSEDFGPQREQDVADLREARAAIAELIEVASLFDSYTAADTGDTSILDQEELWDRLGTALRRVKGEVE